MKRQILRYNHLLTRYKRYRRKLERVNSGRSRYRRIDVLIKRIRQLYHQLLELRTALRIASTGAALVAGAAIAPVTLNGQDFEMRTDIPTRHAQTELNCKPAFADVDGDGDLDLFVGGKSETTPSVIHNDILYFENDNGTFVNAVSPFPDSLNIDPMLSDSARVSPGFVDYDMDGDPDCLIGLEDGSFIYYRNDDGQMTGVMGDENPFDGIVLEPGNASPTFVDVDGDGDMDAVIGKADGTLAYFENVDGTFVIRTGAENPFDAIDVGDNAAPAFLDADGDGDLDLVIGKLDGTLLYYENVEGAYEERTGGDNPFDGLSVSVDSAPAFADLDDDGDMDLFVGGGGPALISYFEKGDSGYSFVNDNPLGISRLGNDPDPGFVDLEGDGDLDVFFGMGEGQVEFFRNDGGMYVQQDSMNNPLNTGIIKAAAIAAPSFADLDNDGDMDCILGTWNENLIYLVNDNGIFTRDDENNPFAGLDPGDNESVAFTDWDGDGDLDAFVGIKAGEVKYYRNDGTPEAGMFVEATENPFLGKDFTNSIQPNFVTRVTAGDVDGDGDDDAFVGRSDGRIVYFENDNGELTRKPLVNPLEGFDFGRGCAPELGDVDGDGDLDLLVSSALGTTYYFENIGVSAVVDPVLTQNTQLYPNPAANMITLEIPWSNGEALIELVHLSGRVIYSERSYAQALDFNVRALPAGMYLVRISGDEGVALKKLVKE